MNLSRQKKTNNEGAGLDLMPIFTFLGVIAIVFTLYIGYRASVTDRKLFSVSFVALFAGLFFESFRISKDWKYVMFIFIGAYLFSFITFLPGKREVDYDFESHIARWPYFFIFFFALAFAIFNKDKVTVKLTEGITLLLSISMIYWTMDYGFTSYHSWFAITLLVIGLVLSVYSIIHAFTNIVLTRTNRLILSTWSTIIMFAFAFDNIFRVFSNDSIESTPYLSEGLYIGLQYFFLGTSAVYIVQHYILLAAFLPSKNGNYKNELKENKKTHIERFSENQVLVSDSMFCILYSGMIYGVNLHYRILPACTLIWFVFLTFPLILNLITGRRENTTAA